MMGSQAVTQKSFSIFVHYSATKNAEPNNTTKVTIIYKLSSSLENIFLNPGIMIHSLACSFRISYK